MSQTPTFVKTARGMSLVEVLVTVVLISVGLLGVAALQLSSLKGNQESYARSQAAMLAADILDRMRANQNAFANNQYNVAFNGTGAAGTPSGNDLQAWQRSINQLLPGGTEIAAGSIARSATNIVTVTIRWSEREERADLQTRDPVEYPTFVTRTEI